MLEVSLNYYYYMILMAFAITADSVILLAKVVFIKILDSSDFVLRNSKHDR